MTKVTAITCPKCKDTIYSRARHDMRYCSCNAIAIDGGFDYIKITASSGILEKARKKTLTIKASKKQIHDDWDYSTDQYGLIKGKVGR